MGNSYPNMIDPDGGYSASNPFLGTGGFGSGGASGLQILGSVSGVLSAAMMGNAFAFPNAMGELMGSETFTENPSSFSFFNILNFSGNYKNNPSPMFGFNLSGGLNGNFGLKKSYLQVENG